MMQQMIGVAQIKTGLLQQDSASRKSKDQAKTIPGDKSIADAWIKNKKKKFSRESLNNPGRSALPRENPSQKENCSRELDIGGQNLVVEYCARRKKITRRKWMEQKSVTKNRRQTVAQAGKSARKNA
jgi:hypothetical protein